MAIRMGVTLAILLPAMLLVGFGRPWYVTFAIAVVAFGAGRLVELLVKSNKRDE